MSSWPMLGRLHSRPTRSVRRRLSHVLNDETLADKD
jgi:hypothetical protein